jgi:phospholipid/cholesterol/gamma-HCH transport system ATP-binding protein
MAMTDIPVLALAGAVGDAPFLPRAPLALSLAPGEFALIDTPGPRRGAVFADLCEGLTPLAAGEVRFLGRDWQQVPQIHAEAMRGRIGRLFHQRLSADTPDVAARILLARLHHTRVPEPDLRAEAASIAVQLGLPGLPVGPARELSEQDLLRAAAVRAFLGEPRLLILELATAAQHEDFIGRLLVVCAAARRRGAAVMWLAVAGPALRLRAVMPTQRLRLSDTGLAAAQHAGPAV